MSAIKKIQELEEAFEQNTISGHSKSGCYVKCKKGLWRVDALTMNEAKAEARHYFFQYWTDGEYVGIGARNRHKAG